MAKRCCLVCHSTERAFSPLNLFQRSGIGATEGNSSDGAIGSDLSAIFVVRNMLGVSSEQCVQLIFKNGNPSSWGLNFCSVCRRIIEEAHFISERIRNLSVEFDGLTNKLKEVNTNSLEGSENDLKGVGRGRRKVGRPSKSAKIERTVDQEIRSWIYDDLKRINVPKVKNENVFPDKITKPVLVPVTRITKININNSTYIEPESELPESTMDENEVDLDHSDAFSIEGETVGSSLSLDFFGIEGMDEEGVAVDNTFLDENIEFNGDVKVKQEAPDDYGDYTIANGLVLCPHNCGKTFETVALAKVHVKRTHEGDPFPHHCDECDFKANRPSILNNHKIKMHSGDKIPCGICGKGFDNLFLVGVHVKRHHEGDPCPYECDRCESKFAGPAMLENHKIKYHGTDRIPCSVCGKGFKSPFLVKVHIKRYHEGDCNPYECQLCGRKFNRPSALKTHRVHYHGEANEHLMEVSSDDDEFKQEDNDEINADTVVFKNKKVDSEDNNEGDGKDEDKKEMNTDEVEVELDETGTSIFRCPRNCGKIFHTLFMANVHVKRSHDDDPNPFYCELCYQSFNRPSRLETHAIQRHSRAAAVIPCPQNCGKLFKTSFMADTHFRKQHERGSNRTQYECLVCKEKFVRPCRLQKHMEKHNKEKKGNKRKITRPTKHSAKGTFKKIIIKNVTSASEIENGLSISNDSVDISQEDENPQAQEMQRLRSSNNNSSNKTEIMDQPEPDSDHADFDEMEHLKSNAIQTSGDESSDNYEQDKSDSSDEEFLPTKVTKEPRKSSKRLQEKPNRRHAKYDILCQENGCGRSFHEQYLLDAHVLRFHLNETKPFYCHLCDKQFKRHARLLVHQTRHHPNCSDGLTTLEFEDDTSNSEDGDQNYEVLANFKPTNEVDAQENLDSTKIQQHDEVGKSYEADVDMKESKEIAALLEQFNENEKLDCDKCKFKLKSKAHLAGHVKVKHEGIRRGYECPACDCTFEKYHSLFEHSQRHVQKSKFLKCTYPDCDKTFKSDIMFDAHIRGFHLGKPKAFKCKKCSKEFRSSGSLYSHLRIEHKCTAYGEPIWNGKKTNQIGRRPISIRLFKCNKCDLKFPSKLSIKAHLRKMHNGSCVCKKCSEEFPTHPDLQRHMRQAHPYLRKEVDCEICGKKMKTPSQLKVHLMSHSNLKPFTCEICGQSYVTERYLSYHQKATHATELGLTSYTCSYCDRVLNNPRSLKFHIMQIHTKEYKFRCTVCPYGSMYQNQLDEHMRLHTGETPIKCPHCPKQFQRKLYLNNHIRLHTGVKPWKCLDCGKEFSDRPTFRRHRETHGTTIYTCTAKKCGKKFKVWHSFRNHMKTHGKVATVPKRPVEAISQPTSSASIDEDDQCQETSEIKKHLSEDPKDITADETNPSAPTENPLPTISTSEGSELANFIKSSVLFD